MKYKKIMRVFSISLLISVILRLVQSLVFTEDATGFSIPRYKSYSIAAIVIIALAIVITAFFSIKTRRCFEDIPHVTVPLMFVSVVIAALSVWDLLDLVNNPTLRKTFALWQMITIYMGGILMALFLIFYALQPIVKISLPGLLYVTPLIFSAVRLVRIFAQMSHISVIADNLFLILANASAVLFFLEFGRLANGYNALSDCRRFLCISNVTTIMCACSSLPCIIKGFVDMSTVSASDMIMYVTTFFVGVFSFAFSVAFFSLKEKR